MQPSPTRSKSGRPRPCIDRTNNRAKVCYFPPSHQEGADMLWYDWDARRKELSKDALCSFRFVLPPAGIERKEARWFLPTSLPCGSGELAERTFLTSNRQTVLRRCYFFFSRNSPLYSRSSSPPLLKILPCRLVHHQYVIFGLLSRISSFFFVPLCLRPLALFRASRMVG